MKLKIHASRINIHLKYIIINIYENTIFIIEIVFNKNTIISNPRYIYKTTLTSN